MKPTLSDRERLVGELISARRVSGASQEDIARQAHVTREFVSLIERYISPAPAHVVFAYVKVCNMNLDATCQKWKLTPPDVQERMGDPKIWELVRAA